MANPEYKIEKLVYEKHSKRSFSSGKYYEILLVTGGSCHFELDGNSIFCGTESAVFLKPEESISMSYHNTRFPLKLLVIRVLPSCLAKLSEKDCNLAESFDFLPLSKSIIHLEVRNTTLIKNMARSILTAAEQEPLFGGELHTKCMLTLLLIEFLRACIASDHVMLSRQRQHLVMDDIFLYIRAHLTEDLSLEALEKEFYVSRYHICREFKRLTGQTVHAYIVKARLDLCKKYIESGKSIKEIYELGGFGGYNHFFRAFKKEYGMTPKQYYESLIEK